MPYADKTKQRSYQAEWMRNRRSEWFEGKVCAHCGAKDHLELDHINPDDKVTHRIWSWTKEKREIELAKCQPLCSSCHKVKSSAARKVEV